MRLLILAAALTCSSAALANQLIPANAAVTVAKSALQVTPARDWNKLSARPGRQSETWTIDGELLNDLSFYGGIESGKPLFREVDRKNRPLPQFKSTILAAEVPALLENSYRIARGVSIFTIDQVEPAAFAGTAGIHFTYSFVGPDELRRSGEGNAAIVAGRLYLTTFEAPTLHYFMRDVASFQQVVGSLKLPK